MADKLLMTRDEVLRALKRISHEVLERNHGVDGLVLIGLHTRGFPLAIRLAKMIREFEGRDFPVGALDIRAYRDDIPTRGSGSYRKNDISVDVVNKKVVLVDDVLFTGRTIRAAMDAVMDLGRPCLIQLAVLVDRGHRELPLRADYVGKNIPTSIDERVDVRLEEIDGYDGVLLTETKKTSDDSNASETKLMSGNSR